MKPTDLDIDDYHTTLQSFHNESDRAAAVLAGSFIESYLAKYLKLFMIEDESDKLFDSDGPLATFNQRVRIAYAFKLINKQTSSDLRFIGKIRNHFAHHPLHASFDSAPVSDFCNQLSMRHVFPISEGASETLTTRNRNYFIISIAMMVATWYREERKPEEPNIYTQIFGPMDTGTPVR
jgi:DNA-binding MltR family transcriptional regulator